MGRRSDFGA